MSKYNVNENNITTNDVKKSKKKKVIIGIIIALVIIIAIVIGFAIKSYAYQYRFEHDSDEINMSNNSITYKYFDNEDEVERKKTYAITDEWLHRMIIRNQPLDNDWDSNPIATDTTIYGPYTWIPAGEYVITFDLTDEGGHAFQYWDVGVNFGNGSCGPQDWDASYSQSNPLVVGGNGAKIYNSHYWRDSSGPHLQYTIYTTGDTADYEFRLYFSSSLGNDIPFTGTGDMSIKKDFLNSVKIEAKTANTISFNADGGKINGKTTGTLTSTYWGKSREKVSVPTKDGYTFMGWYGYSKATNTLPKRSGLTFEKNSEKIKLWNADGTPAIKTEVSYYDYTVYAQWKPNYNLEVNWDSGVSYVKGTDIDGNMITINEGDSYEYHYNYAAPTYIYVKEGYAVDYITETSDDTNWFDTTKNDTLGRWENRWTMNKDRTIYIHTKIADDYGSLTLNGDEGVEKIEGFTKGQTKLYKKGTKVTYKFKVKDGYELDYISEGNAHYQATKLNNDKDGYNYSDYYNINGSRSGYIHTKPASYTLTIDPNYGTMYNGSEETSSKFTTKFLYGRKTYIGNSYTDKYGYLDYENNTPTKEGYTFAGWKFSNGTGGLNSDGSEFFFGEIAADEDTTYDDDDIYIFNGDYAGDVTATAQWETNEYTLKLDANYYNVCFDKLKGDGYDMGTVDLYINGNLEAENITDWNKEYPYGTTYEFKNLKSKNGYILSDAGSLKGTIKGDTTAITYVYDKVGLTYFDKNSDAGGKGTDKYVFYNMVHLVYNKGSVIGNDTIGFTNNNKIFKNWKTDKNNYYNGGDVMPVNDDYQAKAYIQSANANSNLVMDIAWGGMSNDSGLNIQLADAWGGNGEYWSFIKAETGDDDYFIVNSALGKYVTADITNRNVYYGNLDWSNNQVWTLSIAEDGCYYITSKANPNFRITAQGTTKNSNIGLSWKANNNSQKWKILFNNRDSIFTAQWKANTDTKYVVNHWKQNINGNASQHNSTNYTLADTDNFTGTTDTTVRPSVKNYEGFTAPSVQTVNINGDGSTVVNYYYTRNKYTIANVDVTIGNGISNVSGLGTYYYGQEVTLTANLKRGYHWHTSDNCIANKTYPTGWYATQNGYGITTFTHNTSYSSQSVKFTMPANDITLKATGSHTTI